MADLDVDGARKAGVAVPPASKSEYAEASNQLQPGFVATVDGTDPSLGWTVQHRMPEREGLSGEDAAPKEYTEPGDTLPGQVYTPDQLPDPQAAIQAGMAPQKIPAHLITENADHIQGPEPLERLVLKERDRLRRAVLRHREGSAYAGIGDDDEAAETAAEDADADPTGTPKVPAGAGANSGAGAGQQNGGQGNTQTS